MKLLSLLLLLLVASVAVYCQDDDDMMDMGDDDLSMDPDPDADDHDMPEDDIVEPPAEEKPPPEPVKVEYSKPTLPHGSAHFQEPFDDLTLYKKRWIKSQAKKDGVEANIAKYDGIWAVEEVSDSGLIGDMSLVLKSKAHHHAISAALDKTYHFTGKPFIMQYEVRFKNGMECGGAYVKLLTHQDDNKLEQLQDKTPYTIMFGPDKCGNDNKLHFIFRHKNPVTGEYEEKHAKKPSGSLDDYFTDKKTHVYRLVVNSDNTYEISVDQSVVNQGSLLTDVEPAVNPAKEIEDPDDKKPSDWDDKQRIKDPDAVKPDDWDETASEKIDDPDAVKPDGWLDEEPELVPDPTAVKPDDWDDDMDGEWEAPKVSNPKCEEAPGCGEWVRPKIKNPAHKGKWSAPYIDNPDYQGIWKAAMIPNPKFFEDLQPYKMSPIYAIGLELWSMTDEIIFDNFLVTDDLEIADKWTTQTYLVKSMQEKATASANSQSVVGAIMEATHERPWLWAVILVVVVLPIVLIIAYCCFSGGSKEPARTKKSDEPSPDDEPEETAGDGPQNSRSDLEADESPAQNGDDVANDKDEEDEDEENEEEKSGEEEDQDADTTGEGRSLRKRRSRKE